MKQRIAFFFVFLCIVLGRSLAVENENEYLPQTFSGDLDSLLIFAVSPKSSVSGDKSSGDRQALAAKVDFHRWLRDFLAENYCPRENVEVVMNRRAVKGRDVLSYAWEAEGMHLVSAQTRDYFVLVATPLAGGQAFPANLIQPGITIFDQNGEQYIFPNFGKYLMTLLTSSPENSASVGQFLGANIFGKGIVEFSKQRPLGKNGNVKVLPSSRVWDEVAWYRSLRVWKSPSGWAVGFWKRREAMSGDPSALAINKDWF